MIGSLITSQTRIRLLRKFFLNSNNRAHLRGLEAEFGESTNGLRIELNRMERADLLNSIRDGNKKIYFANRKHPLFHDIRNIVLKDSGINRIVEKVVDRLGNIVAVYLTGEMAKGHETKNIELILVGTDIDCNYLAEKVRQAESMTGRNVICSMVEPGSMNEAIAGYNPEEILLLWQTEGKTDGEEVSYE
jgi:hypothetical protein